MTDRPIRVLHLLNSMPSWGCGIVNAVLDILSGQMRDSLEVAVCSGSGEQVSLLQQHGVPFYLLDQKRSVLNLPRAAYSLRRIVEEFEPDIVHCHMMTGVLLARAVRLRARYGLVAHVHNVHQRSSILMGLADRAIAVSEAAREFMRNHGVPAQRLRVVQNGTIGSIRLPDPILVGAKNLLQPAIVTVGGLNRRKGLSELIRAFESVCRKQPQSHLYLVGCGESREEFEAQAAATAFGSQIHFEGFQENPIPYMKAASVFVLASRRESFGLVLTEARQCGCAIVATNVGGIPEALDGGRAGVLVPPQNPEALAAAILRILDHPEEAASLRARARENLDAFHVDRVALQLKEVYRELLGDLRQQSMTRNQPAAGWTAES